MAVHALAATALELSFVYYAIPRMYNLPLKTIATYHISSLGVILLTVGVVKNTFETEKLKDHFYQRFVIDLAIVMSAAYIGWHATYLTNDPMPANAALLICCFNHLIYLVYQTIAKYFNLELPSR